MPSGTLVFSGTISSELTGAKTFLAQWILANAIGATSDIVLVSGDNTIAVPPGATLMLIQPPALNTIAIHLKASGGETGVRLHNVAPNVLSLDSSQTTFILNAASSFAGGAITEISFA